MNLKQCPYCDGEVKQTLTGKMLYPHRPDLFNKKFWQCEPCGAYVGCHKSNGEPLGTVANTETRKARMAAHSAFDPFWKSGKTSRKLAYRWLSYQLNYVLDQCHISWMDAEECRRVVEVCNKNMPVRAHTGTNLGDRNG